MKAADWTGRFTFFPIGVFVVLAMLFLTGATSFFANRPIPVENLGETRF